MGKDKERLGELHGLGQSVWLDFISRDLIETGRLEELIGLGVTGMTTNPSIFQKAISQGTRYDREIADLAAQGLDAAGILDRVIITDVQSAADLLRPVFERSGHLDGFVSIEVPPSLADDTDGTVREAHRLWEAVARPNVMVKIPGTAAGIPAIRDCLADALNINITLMFSMGHYEAVVEAFLSALEERRTRGREVTGIASVASFFVSRVDSKVDKRIDERLGAGAGGEERLALQRLRGRLGVANSKLVYERFVEVLSSGRWAALAGAGASPQRVLWASTSTKDPAYSDVLYVDNLIGPDTIDTLPLETLEAFVDHGVARRTVDVDLPAAHEDFSQAARLAIDMRTVTQELQREGVDLFAVSYEALLGGIEEKRRAIVGDEEGRKRA